MLTKTPDTSLSRFCVKFIAVHYRCQCFHRRCERCFLNGVALYWWSYSVDSLRRWSKIMANARKCWKGNTWGWISVKLKVSKFSISKVEDWFCVVFVEKEVVVTKLNICSVLTRFIVVARMILVEFSGCCFCCIHRERSC